MFCLQNQTRHNRPGAAFLVVGEARCRNLYFTLEGAFRNSLATGLLKTSLKCKPLNLHRVYLPSSLVHVFY